MSNVYIHPTSDIFLCTLSKNNQELVRIDIFTWVNGLHSLVNRIVPNETRNRKVTVSIQSVFPISSEEGIFDA